MLAVTAQTPQVQGEERSVAYKARARSAEADPSQAARTYKVYC